MVRKYLQAKPELKVLQWRIARPVRPGGSLTLRNHCALPGIIPWRAFENMMSVLFRVKHARRMVLRRNSREM